ncbi:MAG: hypothetical protein IJ220_05775 [Clostridia bacterium]|nr:hypothetical protein [Clostridia bacterium]
MKKYLLFLMALTTVALVGCGNVKKENDIENNAETQVVEDTSDNTVDAEPEIKVLTNYEVIADLFAKYIEKASAGSGDGLAEYMITNINILSDEEKADIISNFPEDYFASDVLAVINFSVRPEDPNSMAWQAGNGELSGEWVLNKSLVVTLRDGKLINIGTGW